MDPSQPDPRDYTSGRGYLTPVAPLPEPSELISAPRPTAVRAAMTERPAETVDERLDWSEVLQGAPPWLGSLVVHMMLLIFLGLIVVSIKKVSDDKTMEATYGEKLGDQLLEDNSLGLSTDKPDPTVTKTEFSPIDLPPVDNPLAAPPVITDLTPTSHGGFTAGTKAIDAPIGFALSGRQRGHKIALLGAYGGNATTESAVHKALQWLQKNQRANGLWSLTGPYSEGANGENHVAATAMALLAFQGAGFTHQQNGDAKADYKSVVRKGWEGLLKMQNADGQFSEIGVPGVQTLYSHAQATIALCELYGMTQDSSFRTPAEKAIQYCVKSQAPPGGWRYTPKEDSDTSVTGWFVMALQSAQMAGLEVPSLTMQNVTKYLDSAQGESGGSRYHYFPRSYSNVAMTAEGLLCRQYLGWKQDDPRLVDGVEYLAKNPINNQEVDVYQWYYQTQVMHHMGGQYWKEWNEVMRQLIPEAQTKKGAEEGSWDPSGDKYRSAGGRLYVTCLRSYMLEVYYRHLPLYANVYEAKEESSPTEKPMNGDSEKDKSGDAPQPNSEKSE